MIKDAMANIAKRLRLKLSSGVLWRQTKQLLLAASSSFAPMYVDERMVDRTELPASREVNLGSLKQTSFIIHYLGWQASNMF
jgi:hypothetical protein